MRHALDVLAIACVLPKVQLLFCERVDLPEESITYGEYRIGKTNFASFLKKQLLHYLDFFLKLQKAFVQ